MLQIQTFGEFDTLICTGRHSEYITHIKEADIMAYHSALVIQHYFIQSELRDMLLRSRWGGETCSRMAEGQTADFGDGSQGLPVVSPTTYAVKHPGPSTVLVWIHELALASISRCLSVVIVFPHGNQSSGC